MKYVVIIVEDAGGISTLTTDHDLDRAKRAADMLQTNIVNQVKVLEQTRHGYRIAYIARRVTDSHH